MPWDCAVSIIAVIRARPAPSPVLSGGNHNGVLLLWGVTYALAERTIGGESYDILDSFRDKERLVIYQVLNLLDGFFYAVKGHQAIADIAIPNPCNLNRGPWATRGEWLHAAFPWAFLGRVVWYS